MIINFRWNVTPLDLSSSTNCHQLEDLFHSSSWFQPRQWDLFNTTERVRLQMDFSKTVKQLDYLNATRCIDTAAGIDLQPAVQGTVFHSNVQTAESIRKVSIHDYESISYRPSAAFSVQKIRKISS